MPESGAVKVRPARLEDYESACRLMDSLDALHRERLPWMFEPPSEPARTRTHFEDLLTSEDSSMYVAEAVGVVGVAVGFMRAAPQRPIFVQQRWAVLDGIVVEPAWRGRGLGKLLAQSVENWGFRTGAAWVEVNVYEANPEARRFYEALGYLPLSTRLRIGGRPEKPRAKLDLAADSTIAPQVK